MPSILDVNGSISFEITGWYNRQKEKGEKKIRDFDGEIVLEEDPRVLENFRAKGYDGKLLRHTLNESTRGQEREGKIRNYFAKRGFIHAKEYIAITFPFMISGLLPMGRDWGYINLASSWSYAPPKLYDKWIRLPDPNISKNGKFALGPPPSGEIESDLEVEQDTPYLVTIILESNGLSHLFVDNNHLVSHIDRSWNHDFVDLAMLHGGMYLRDCGPGTLWNGDWNISYS
jgi:hypothetical protein